ncbi:hypothetical protein KY290_035038 [Solanum tuberosum]|uniref:KxDL domain-containing protein n=1 Tax=Solanum tuberosum TaxID=4113 RepID=A0ABQ7U8H3_SOLTU|nr:hypothetical protein KY289_034472 [Solanum tuberosum]KAH0645721.1 hypothetical protein KY284_033605 [Solanum tuberosum]KAH0649596.1 hypothetical protein KY285_034844 [Solanum tuberosum]KAH0741995.1 hypothetical protein KY290_035038 [Solanum tuberosum]
MEETENESIKSASEEISSEFKTLINAKDLDSLKQLQNLILGRLQDSNAVLSHFNEYSEHCYAEVSTDFSRNTRLLKSMKSDLDYIFLKLSFIQPHSPPVSILDDIVMLHRDTRAFLDYWLYSQNRAKIISTYPDALPDNTTIQALDQRPDLEMPQ